jgi:hypothetical protein
MQGANALTACSVPFSRRFDEGRSGRELLTVGSQLLVVSLDIRNLGHSDEVSNK